MTNGKRIGFDTLMNGVASGEMSRRDIIKTAAALGLGSAFGAALVNASGVDAQDGMTLTFDAGATQGGGGKPNAALVDYSYVINGGNQFEINRMVDARLITLSSDIQEFVGDLAETLGDRRRCRNLQARPERGLARWHPGHRQRRGLHDQSPD